MPRQLAQIALLFWYTVNKLNDLSNQIAPYRAIVLVKIPIVIRRSNFDFGKTTSCGL